MISNLQETGSLNVVKDFYAQLSIVRPIDHISIINALNCHENMDSSKLISSSVTYRTWMSQISLEDIRNHIIFTIWKEHQTIISDSPYYDKTINNESYHNSSKPHGQLSIHTEEIGKLLETSFYIHQICAIKEMIDDEFDDLSIVDEAEWDMYHDWLLASVTKKGLVYVVYENFKLIEGLINHHQ